MQSVLDARSVRRAVGQHACVRARECRRRTPKKESDPARDRSRDGCWLHRAEPELSVLTRQALSTRRPTQDAVHTQVTAWAEARHAAPKGINWPFRTADARVRLKHPYPTI